MYAIRSYYVLKPMPIDKMAFSMLQDKGFIILPRLSDNIPYDQAAMDEELKYFADHGVNRILFDGEAVKGFQDNEEMSYNFV